MNKEIATLAAVLNDGDIATLLTAKPVLFESYGDVYEFILDYYSKNSDLPPAKIVEQKFSVKFPEVVGTTKHHLDDLSNLYMKRRLQSVVLKTTEQLQDGNLAGALATAASAATIRQESSDSHDLDATDIESAIAHIQSIKEMNARGSYGIKFGIPGIDDFLPSGVVPGMFGLIMGYPGRGKSFLATLLAVRAWDCGKKVLYVSLEMTETEVRARVYTIAGEGEWSLSRLQRGDVDIEAFSKWAGVRFEDKGVFPIINNDGYNRFSPSSLRAKIEEYQPDLVLVDYIQLMVPDSDTSNGNETIKLKTLSQDLKVVAMSSGVAVIGVVSATPADSTDMDTIPELGQVAWSKQLAYDADWMLAVGRADNSPEMAIAWRKNRNGPLTDFALRCDFDAGIFTYMDLDFM